MSSGIDPRRAWRAGAIDALGVRVRPAFRRITQPIAISQDGLRRSTSSGPVSGQAHPSATVVVGVDGTFFKTVAGTDGGWTVQTSAGQGDHDLAAWQVTERGIHAPAQARLRVRAPWILATGFWNDDGAWDDDAVWID